MEHGENYEDSFWDVISLVGHVPVREDRVRCLRVSLVENSGHYSTLVESQYEIVELSTGFSLHFFVCDGEILHEFVGLHGFFVQIELGWSDSVHASCEAARLLNCKHL